MEDLSDHDMIRRIFDYVYEPETGLKAQSLKIAETIWGRNGHPGLVIRMSTSEDDYKKVLRVAEEAHDRADDVGIEVSEVKQQIVVLAKDQKNPIIFTFSRRRMYALIGAALLGLLGSQFLWDFIRTILNLPLHG